MTGLAATYAVSAALANVAGALAVTSGARWSVRALDRMLAFAAGFLLSVAFVDLLPEAYEHSGRTGAGVALVAFVLVHLTQHSIGQHFHFGEERHAVSRMSSGSALIGLLMHTFVDGVAVASGLLVNTTVGALVFMGVVLHKLPEGLAISSLFMASGSSRRAAIGAAAALGLATILGVALTDMIGGLRTYGMAISAGVTIYVGASNLVPELQKRGGWETPVSFVAGCGAYVLSRLAL
ncbi:MAG TPA: ZIP family metal transporter [Gemmatimonadaceae bacterium]